MEVPGLSPTYPRVRSEAVEACFGPTMTARGRAYWQEDRIRTVHWDEATQKLTGSVFGSGESIYRATVLLLRSGPDAWEPDRSGCTCPVGDDCKHGAALVFRADELARDRAEDPFAVLRALEEQSGLIQRASALGGGSGGQSGQRGQTAGSPALEPPSWQRTLGALVPPGTVGSAGAGQERAARKPVFDQLALGLDVHVATSERHRLYGGIQWTSLGHEYLGSTARWTVQVRPLKRSARGNWVKTGLTWQTFSRQRPPHTLNPDPVQYELLHRLQHLYHATVASPARSEWLNLATLDHPEAWRLLGALQEAGAPLVGLGLIGEITLTDPAELVLDVRRTDPDTDADPAALALQLRARTAGSDLLDDARPVGSRAVVVARPHPDGSTGKESILVQLSPLDTPVPTGLRGLLAGGEPLQVPAEETPEFFDDFYPGLAASLDVVSSDDTVEFPEIPPPELRLSASYTLADPDDDWAQDTLELSWSWYYRGYDDVDEHQRTVLAAVREIWPGAFTQPEQTLAGPAAARFSEHALDQLRDLDHVHVSIIGTRPDYRELTGAPDIGITAVASGTSNDWFDLGFQIRLDGRSVPFAHIFKALVKGENEVLLPDKTYLSLDHPGFDRLRELIDEAGQLEEWDPENQGVHRSNTVMLQDLEELADEWTPDAMVEEWMDTITRLASLDPNDHPDPAEVPTSLDATLRPYQLHGFRWLATLHDLGLGGILADDMGLGKTLQTLALIAHARETTHDGEQSTSAPFLVVAPSSVVSVWAQEAAKFTPELRVVTLSATAAKRKKSAEDIDAELAEADLVLTSYAIARLDEKILAARTWGGLVLDEAQFVKNRTTRTFRSVKALAERSRFRLAITGTPMENTLGDLWSLAALTAPGLFPQFRLFREHFINPIEAGQRLATDPSLNPEDDPEGARTAQRAESRLAHLRDRLAPFMLRRTKEDVAPDLPEKQEQTVLVPLQSAHRRLYDTVLQRERAKVMRLLNEEDLDTHRMIVFRSLTLLRMLALDPQIVDQDYTEPSSKLEDLMERLTEIHDAEEHHQVIVFSQFTSFLHRVAKRLDDAEISYAYLDGATRDRAAAVAEFREGGATVFLISLKAGGFGLTLTEADYVFLMDPWWNPAVENQAVDRAHRIGQTKNVMVYRMVAAGTIEEKVLELQYRKAVLFDAVTEGAPGGAVSSGFTAADFRALFSQPRSLEE